METKGSGARRKEEERRRCEVFARDKEKEKKTGALANRGGAREKRREKAE